MREYFKYAYQAVRAMNEIYNVREIPGVFFTPRAPFGGRTTLEALLEDPKRVRDYYYAMTKRQI